MFDKFVSFRLLVIKFSGDSNRTNLILGYEPSEFPELYPTIYEPKPV